MSSPGRLAGALTAAAVVLGVAAQPAAAQVTFSGIGEVRLHMSESEVHDVLGPPSDTEPAPNPEAVNLRYHRVKIDVMVHRQDDRVVGMTTTSRAQRTSSGLGVGSSTSVVRSKLRGEKCGTARETLVCSVERRGRVMDFRIRRGKVVSVAVTTVG
jgi:hypothetical protein